MADPLKMVIDTYGEWWRAVRSPWQATVTALAGRSSKEHIRRANSVWFAAFFLSLVITLPLYTLFGLPFEKIGFQLCAVLAQYLSLIAFAYAFHLSLVRHRINSRFPDTFALYTIVTAAIGPFMALVSLPYLTRCLTIAEEVKKKKLDTMSGITELMRQIATPDTRVSSLVVMAAQPLMILLSFWLLASFVGLVAEHYGAETRQVVRAVAFAVAVPCAVISVSVLALQHVLLFVFMSAG